MAFAFALENGRGVERDNKKAKQEYYYELAAIGGDVFARYDLGCLEGRASNFDRVVSDKYRCLLLLQFFTYECLLYNL